MRKKLSPQFRTAPVRFSLIGQAAWVVENMNRNVCVCRMFHAGGRDIFLTAVILSKQNRGEAA